MSDEEKNRIAASEARRDQTLSDRAEKRRQHNLMMAKKYGWDTKPYEKPEDNK